jgi:NitT/TauT family transport system permease protein
MTAYVKPSWQAVLALLLTLVASFMSAMTVPEAQALADPTTTMNYPYVERAASSRSC